MKSARGLGGVAALALGISLLAGCGGEARQGGDPALEPVAIQDQEGAVCGMLLAEQTAPRGQVVHRDGERAFLCSISDLLAYLDAPSPHGKAVKVLVEVMDASQDPSVAHKGPHPWLDAGEAVYVVGIERSGVMGEPVLIYHDAAAAEAVTAGTSARILDFDALRARWAERQSAGSHH